MNQKRKKDNKIFKVLLIGHYGKKNKYYDGQTVKTITLTNALIKKYGESSVKCLDTHGRLRVIFKLAFVLPLLMKHSKNVIMLPAQNGIKVLSFLLIFLNLFYKTKLHYSVIGGWLPSFLDKKSYVKNRLKKFDYIYVETLTMKNKLELIGFTNVSVVKNFKNIAILNIDELSTTYTLPLKLCTFSRVMKEKGIEDAINVVRKINNEFNRIVFSLDIYGQIDSNQIKWFEELKKTFDPSIKYCGVIDANKSVEVLKNYFVLLFPTRFFTEGIPGTIIDAYGSGLPVVSSKWQSFDDVIDHGVTGFGYEFKNLDSLYELLIKIKDNPILIMNMKENCIKKAFSYLPESVIDYLYLE